MNSKTDTIVLLATASFLLIRIKLQKRKQQMNYPWNNARHLLPGLWFTFRASLGRLVLLGSLLEWD
jgi:hypothetical protein